MVNLGGGGQADENQIDLCNKAPAFNSTEVSNNMGGVTDIPTSVHDKPDLYQGIPTGLNYLVYNVELYVFIFNLGFCQSAFLYTCTTFICHSFHIPVFLCVI